MAIWRYVTSKTVTHYSNLLDGVHCKTDYLTIANNEVRVEWGYAWDGCSPSWKICGMWFGVWDGPRGKDGRPSAWLASLIHDAVCQYRDEITGLSTDTSVALFKELLVLKDSPSWMTWLYPFAVKLYGSKSWSK